MAIQTSIVARNAELDALAPLANSGYIRIYTGSIPATPETAVSGTLLAELQFGATAFGAAAAGVITANAITQDSSADNTGVASSRMNRNRSSASGLISIASKSNSIAKSSSSDASGFIVDDMADLLVVLSLME